MSVSEGLLRGYQIGSGIMDRQFRREQAELDERYRRDVLAIQEAQEARAQSQFEFQNDLGQLEEYYAEMERESYGNEAATKGRGVALINSVERNSGGDVTTHLMSPEGRKEIADNIATSSEVMAAVTSNPNVDRIVSIEPVNVPDSQEIRDRGIDPNGNNFVIAVGTKDGRIAPITDGRESGQGKGMPTIFSEADISGMTAQALREQGVFKDPAVLQRMEAAGYDMEGTLAMLDGENFAAKVPKAPSLAGVKQAINARRKEEVVSDPKLVDGKDREVISSSNLSPNRVAAIESSAATDEAVQLAKESDPLLELGATVGEAGTALKEGVQEYARSNQALLPKLGRKLGEAAYKMKQVFDQVPDARTAAFASLIKGKEVLFGASTGDDAAQAKAKDKDVIDAFDDKKPNVPQQQGEDAISAQVNSQSAPERVATGTLDVSNMSSISRGNRRPSPRAKAIATRLYANGLLPAQSYATYLETGKFSLADIAAAAQENNARANLIRARTGFAKELNASGKEIADQRKEDTDRMLATGATILAQELAKNGTFAKLDLDIDKQATAMIESLMYDPRVYTKLGLDSPYQYTQKDVSNMVDFLSRKGHKQLSIGEERTFSRDVPNSITLPDNLVKEFMKEFAPTRPLDN